MRTAPFAISAALLAAVHTTVAAQQQGLLGEYYDGTNFQTKVASRTDRQINFDWEDQRPVAGLGYSYFSVRWTGKILAPRSGKYAFSAKVDDGIRVWVGGKKVIDAWDLHDSEHFNGSVELEANRYYDLKVEYFNAMLEGEIQLRWNMPGETGPAKTVDAKYYAPSSAKNKPDTVADKPAANNKPAAVPAKNKRSKSKPASPKPVPAKPEPAPEVKKRTESAPEPPPAAELAKKQRELELKHIYFVQSKDEILPASSTTLDDWVTFLNQKKDAVIHVRGHTDDLGNADKNLELSEKRAQLVADYLAERGIGRERIVAKGYGSTKPYFVNAVTEKERALNRRVEIGVK